MNLTATHSDMRLFTHIVLALMCLPLYSILGEYFKFAMMPYVLYLFYAKKIEFIVPLIIHSAAGSTMSFFILLMTLYLSIIHYASLKERGLDKLFLLALLPLPIFVWQSFNRMVFMNENLINTITPLSFYLGLFPFFYYTTFKERLKVESFVAIIYTLLFIWLMGRFGLYKSYKYNAFLFSFMLGLGLINIFSKKGMKRNLFLNFSSILIVLLVPLQLLLVKFNILMPAFFMFLMVLLNFKVLKRYIQKYVTWKLFLGVFLFTMVGVRFASNEVKSYELMALSYTNVFDWFKIIQLKFFGERGVVWLAVVEAIIENKAWYPLYEPLNYSYTGKGIEKEAEIPAHNLFLELMRSYGVLLGLWISIVYMAIVVKFGKLSIVASKLNSNYYILVVSVFSVMLLPALVNQYTLHPNFSFMLLGLAGALILNQNSDMNSNPIATN